MPEKHLVKINLNIPGGDMVELSYTTTNPFEPNPVVAGLVQFLQSIIKPEVTHGNVK